MNKRRHAFGVVAAGLLLAASCTRNEQPVPAIDARSALPELARVAKAPARDAAPDLADAAPAPASDAAAPKKARAASHRAAPIPQAAPTAAVDPSGPAEGVASVGKITIAGGVPGPDAERVVRGKVGAFRKCYEHELAKSPKLRGRMLLVLTVAPTGGVELADVQKSTLSSGEAEMCVAQAARDFRFPKPVDGQPATVSVSIDYR